MQGNVIPFELSGAEFRNQAGITELVQPRSQNYTHFLVELEQLRSGKHVASPSGVSPSSPFRPTSVTLQSLGSATACVECKNAADNLARYTTVSPNGHVLAVLFPSTSGMSGGERHTPTFLRTGVVVTTRIGAEVERLRLGEESTCY